MDELFKNPINNEGLLGIVCAVRDGLFPMLLVFGVIAFIAAGLLYFMASGDSGKLATAKKALLAAIIGTVLAILSRGAVFIVGQVMGFDPGALC